MTDEDIPSSTARVLYDAGFETVDARDVGLRGKSDAVIFAYAQREKRIVIPCDLGFLNILKFPPARPVGLIVVPIPDSEPIEIFNKEIVRAVSEIGENFHQRLANVEIGRVRLQA